MGSTYAKGTEVTVARSRDDLERLLKARGATGFMFGWEEGNDNYVVAFRLADRLIRLTVPRPWPGDHQRTPTGRRRTERSAGQLAEAEERRRWRSLLLVIKARLVAVDDGVETLETAFLPWVVLPNGQTIAQWLGPQLDTVYATQVMPALLPGAAAGELPAGPAVRAISSREDQ